MIIIRPSLQALRSEDPVKEMMPRKDTFKYKADDIDIL